MTMFFSSKIQTLLEQSESVFVFYYGRNFSRKDKVGTVQLPLSNKREVWAEATYIMNFYGIF